MIGSRTTPISSGQQEEEEGEEEGHDGRNSSSTTRKRHGARNQHRHKFFVKWIMETFPFLSKGENEGGEQQQPQQQALHILDVGGGRGESSARLCMCHRQNVVMVDPRPADIVRCFETLVLPKIPKKWQQRLLHQQATNPNFVREAIDSRFRQLVTTFDEDRVSTSAELQEAIERSNLILGLHADGATEAIVDFALKYQKPFVVVPCCVFPNLFRDRCIRDESNGNQLVPVRTHEQFVEYLAQKDPRFVVEKLPFEGRNVAIWWDGK